MALRAVDRATTCRFALARILNFKRPPRRRVAVRSWWQRFPRRHWRAAGFIALALGLLVWQLRDGDGRVMGMCGLLNDGTCVINGDTIQYQGMRVQIQDIEAPETQDAKCLAELELGRKAAQRLRELLDAGPFEVIYMGGADTDRYGRKLRLVVRDGHSLGDIMVAEGLARRPDGRRHNWC
ncbi:MAG: thermonuclease family protein [Rhodospirillales bacterium]